MLNKTTYPKAKLAAIKKRGGEYIAFDLFTNMYLDVGRSYTHAKESAEWSVNQFTTRQLYVYLRNNGYTFNVGDARWYTEDVK